MPSSTSSSELCRIAAAAEGVAVPTLRASRLRAPDRVRSARRRAAGAERDIPPQPWGRILLGALAVLRAAARRLGTVLARVRRDARLSQQRRRVGAAAAAHRRGRRRQDRADRLLARAVRRAAAGVGTPHRRAADPARARRHVAGAGARRSRERSRISPAACWSASRRTCSSVASPIAATCFRTTTSRAPSQRIGHWLSKHLLEPYFAFYDPDFALATVVRRQAWPLRPGMHQGTRGAQADACRTPTATRTCGARSRTIPRIARSRAASGPSISPGRRRRAWTRRRNCRR